MSQEPSHFYDGRSANGQRGRVQLKAITTKRDTYLHITYQYPGLNCAYKGPLLSRTGAEELIRQIRAVFPEEQTDEPQCSYCDGTGIVPEGAR